MNSSEDLRALEELEQQKAALIKEKEDFRVGETFVFSFFTESLFALVVVAFWFAVEIFKGRGGLGLFGVKWYDLVWGVCLGNSVKVVLYIICTYVI